MKAATQKSYRLMHTWLGLICGALLFIGFYAGALTIFHQELSNWYQQIRHVSSEPALTQSKPARPEALNQLQQQIDFLLKSQPEASHGFSVSLPTAEQPAGKVRWFDEQTGTSQRVDLAAQGQLQLSEDPQNVIDFIYVLHFTAGLPQQFGTYLFGFVCVLYGLALVSGVVIYLPVLAKDILAMRWQQAGKTRWLDLHNLLGLTSLPFHLLFAWSGAILTISLVLLAPFQYLIFDGTLLEKLEPDFEVVAHVEVSGEQRPLLDLTTLYQRAQQALPKMTITSAYYHDAGDLNGNITLYGDYPQTAADRTVTQVAAVVLSTVDGRVVGQLTPAEFRPGTTFMRGLTSLHYGNFAGYSGKWLFFILGIAGAVLFYSGNWLWLRKRANLDYRWPLRLMNALTNGVCLGTVIAVSLLLSVAALLPEKWNNPLFAAVLIACMLYSLFRPARACRTELLYLAAGASLLIPLLQWTGITAMSTGSTAMILNLGALLFTCCFFGLAIWSRKKQQSMPALLQPASPMLSTPEY